MLAQEMNLPFLGRVPIHLNLRINSDEGRPLSNWDEPALADEFDQLCKNLAAQISIAAASGAYVQPTMSIS